MISYYFCDGLAAATLNQTTLELLQLFVICCVFCFVNFVKLLVYLLPFTSIV